MIKKFISSLIGIGFLLGAGGASAATITDTIGDQDFADGLTPLLLSAFTDAKASEPDPFNVFFGSDPDGTFGQFTYTHLFALGGLPPVSAALTLGLFDHDSFNVADDTLGILFDGIRQDASIWLGISAGEFSSVSVRTMNVDVALLLDGQLTVDVFARRVSLQNGNGIGPDFSTLNINVAPIPGALPLFASGMGLLSLLGWRRKRATAAA